jgi:hypothetical protein
MAHEELTRPVFDMGKRADKDRYGENTCTERGRSPIGRRDFAVPSRGL